MDKHKETLKQVLERQLRHLNESIDSSVQRIVDLQDAVASMKAEREDVRRELDTLGD